MKKAIAITLAAVLLLSFVACGGSGVTKESLVGTWEVTEAKVDGGEFLVGSTMTFDNDNHYKWETMGITLLEGEYKISGAYVYLDGEKEIFTIKDNVLTVKDASGEMSLIKK